MPQLLHAADIHLDSPLLGLRRAAGDVDREVLHAALTATRTAFTQLIETALEQEVAGLLLAGDLYDEDWKDFATGRFFIREMNRLFEAGIPVFIVLGNHDAASQITKSLRLPRNVHVFGHRQPDSSRGPDDSYVVHGQSFGSRSVPQNLALDYPRAERGLLNFGLLHTSLTGREGHADYAPCSAHDLTQLGYQYWALGHVHRREVVSESPWIVFPGNLQGRHIRETGPKGATLIEFHGDTIDWVEPIALHAVRWEQADVAMTDIATLDDALDAIETALTATGERLEEVGDPTPAIVRVRLHGSTPLHGAWQEPTQRVQLLQEARAMAPRAMRRDVLIEEVRIASSPASRGPVGDFTGGLPLAEADSLEIARYAFANEVQELRRKFRSRLEECELDEAALLAEGRALLESRLGLDAGGDA